MANVITNFFDKLVANRVDKAVELELQKQADIAKKNDDILFTSLTGPYGYKAEKPLEKPNPRGVNWTTLRAFAQFYPIARACVNYRKSQITQLDWDVVLKEEKKDPTESGTEGEQTQEEDTRITELKKFLKYPTGSRSITFRHFINQTLEDVLVIDALALYKKMNRGGKVRGYLPVDGSTIKLKINKDGTFPEPPDIAYVQEIKGRVVAELTTDEMIYRILNPRTTTPYGLSALETLIITISTALKLQSHNLAYLSEGNVPEGLVELPKDVASSPEQIKKWQTTWDSMLAGDARALSRMRFLPEGMKYTATKKQSDMAFERFERWLLQSTCTVFGVQPQDIGFTYETNRATAEVQWEVGKERGLFPLALYLKEVFDEIIQMDFGHEDLEFVWTNINPTNKKDEADVFKALVDTGAVSVDEWRIAEGKKPLGLGPYIKVGGSPMLVDKFLEQQEQEDFMDDGEFVEDIGDEDVEDEEKETPPPVEGDGDKKIPPATKSDKIMNQVKGLADTPELMKELKKWKKVAIHDIERGRPFRTFQSNLIDDRTRTLITDGLKKAKSTKDIVELFEPFLSPESRIINAVLDLYDDLGQALN
jgi:hypothetical protein